MVQHQLQPQNITMENVPAVTHEGTFENIRAHAMQVLPRPSTDPYVLRPSTDPFVAQKFKSIKDADSSVTL
jgi:site-specific DNA-cytosine methylase